MINNLDLLFLRDRLILVSITIKNISMSKDNFKLSLDSNIMETVEHYPFAAEIFAKHGLPCLGCSAARFEKISDVVVEFGIEGDKLIEDIKNHPENKNK